LRLLRKLGLHAESLLAGPGRKAAPGAAAAREARDRRAKRRKQ
jgi:hypothetical protein